MVNALFESDFRKIFLEKLFKNYLLFVHCHFDILILTLMDLLRGTKSLALNLKENDFLFLSWF